MLAGGFEPAEQFDFVEAIVAVGVAQPVEAMRPPSLIDHHIQAVEGI